MNDQEKKCPQCGFEASNFTICPECRDIGMVDKDTESPTPSGQAEFDLLGGQLEAACKLIGHIADCPYCHFGVEKEECSEDCNKFERGEGWECWKDYLGKQAI